MQRGNTRKATLVKFLQGTLDPSRHADEAFQPVPREEIGEPPARWKPDSVARREWEYALVNCPKGMLKSTDRALLTLFCEAMDVYEFCGDRIEEEGLVIRCGKHDELVKQNPHSAIREHAALRIRQIGDLLGFSPASRARLRTGETSPEAKNEWDAIKAKTASALEGVDMATTPQMRQKQKKGKLTPSALN